ncbi:hypothetical protein NDN08_002968 [Rhodosorus marinus]|uniref:Uncharacterized protein n=1 Tax=Rhodosorus marinus TaxID=101924 RepID=A0A7S3EEI5_9RHOD|nr:hypothetical protein NDN08_002968 [Rhodosorus marinus]|mmetsp:Transcript_30525/g.116795  ORF Transcript_30525/g.116795 Transcript_30525/m.116795 type:complete len:149 (+) Transcript_30525:370-816(+)
MMRGGILVGMRDFVSGLSRRFVSGKAETKELWQGTQWRRRRLMDFALKGAQVPSEMLRNGQGYLWIGRHGAAWPLAATPISEEESFRPLKEGVQARKLTNRAVKHKRNEILKQRRRKEMHKIIKNELYPRQKRKPKNTVIVPNRERSD